VIAIIGILIALLLPAVQAAREAARRAQCSNNLKQLGLGLLNYEAANTTLPCSSVAYNMTALKAAGSGGRGYPRQGWLAPLLPFIEQATLYSLYNPNAPNVRGGTNWCYTANALNPLTSPLSQPIQTILCPSDGRGGPVRDYFTFLAGPAQCGYFAAGNYMAFTGNYSFRYQMIPGSGDILTPTAGQVPFYKAAFPPAIWLRLNEITDGLSNTMFLGEYLTGLPTSEQPQDERGWIYQDEPTSSTIDTMNTPNSTNPDKMYPGSCNDGPQIGNHPEFNLPCMDLVTRSPQNGDENGSSRSRHNGGVFVVMGDGSVRFMSNEIAKVTWQSLGGANEGNSISAY